MGHTNELPGAVEQSIIDPPGIDPDAAQRITESRHRLGQTGLDLTEQTNGVPVNAAEDIRAAVRKPMDLLQSHSGTVIDTNHNTTALSAQIDGCVTFAFDHATPRSAAGLAPYRFPTDYTRAGRSYFIQPKSNKAGDEQSSAALFLRCMKVFFINRQYS
jgi:hypothetical protein